VKEMVYLPHPSIGDLWIAAMVSDSRRRKEFHKKIELAPEQDTSSWTSICPTVPRAGYIYMLLK
jgi:hypothetical protein